MKQIFLTGGTGLLGKDFLQKIPKDIFEITLGMREQKRGLEHFNWQYFDLDNADAALDLSGFDIVVHLASNTKDLSADSDIKGIQKILEAIKVVKTIALVVASL